MDEEQPRARRWVMVACAVTALTISITLAALGIVGPDVLFVVIAAVALMLMALGGLPDGDPKNTRQ